MTVPAKKNSWRVVDIVTAAVLGVACGLLFWVWNSIGDAGFKALDALTPGLGGLVTGIWFTGGVLGGLIIGLIETFWSAYFSIEYKDVGFTIEDDGHATVTFQASVPEGVQAECDVLVTDSHAAPVGFRTVRLETLPADRRDSPSDAQQRYTVDVRTVVRGDSGVVETCRKV